MGFKPIVTGATSRRVNRFATATPVDTRMLLSHNRFELLSPGCKPAALRDAGPAHPCAMGVLPLDECDPGGTRQARTANRLLAKQVLSRLSYGPVIWCPMAESNCRFLVESRVS